MPVSDAQRRANAKHNREHYEYCTVKVRKGEKDKIRVAADAKRESVNAYIIRAVTERMERDERSS